MRFSTLGASALALAVTLFVSMGSANAQATRTWVSGVGDDANPCSRTAPCQTFATALSKTSPGGEINVLDPGGFGAVTINKAITISSEGFEAGVLVSGTNGIVIQAGANDTVILRGLDIEGLGTGLDGIKFLSGGALYVEKTIIHHFTANGINFAPNQATPALLFVTDVYSRHNGVNGILIQPAGGAAIQASISKSQLFDNTAAGLRAEGTNGSTNVSVSEVNSNGNNGAGFAVFTTSGAVRMNIDSSVSSNNANGLNSNGANAVLRIGRSMVFNNGKNGSSANSGTLSSYGNNQIDDNTTTNTIPVIPEH